MSVSLPISFLSSHRSHRLYQSGVPVAIAPSGSFANNGALTLAGPPTLTYVEAGCFMYFPANAIAAGVAAGFYWTSFSSTTAATVYNDTYSASVNVPPVVPLSPTPFSTTGPGVYAGETSEITAYQFTVPGGSMKLNGKIELNMLYCLGMANTNAKTTRFKYGGTTFWTQTVTSATQLGVRARVDVSNCGVYNRQESSNWSHSGAVNFTAGPQLGTVDSSTDQTAAVTMSHATATDWMISNYVSAEVHPYG